MLTTNVNHAVAAVPPELPVHDATCDLFKLPQDMFPVIFTYLTVQDVELIARVSSYLHRAVHADPNVWTDFIYRDCPKDLLGRYVSHLVVAQGLQDDDTRAAEGTAKPESDPTRDDDDDEGERLRQKKTLAAGALRRLYIGLRAINCHFPALCADSIAAAQLSTVTTNAPPPVSPRNKAKKRLFYFHPVFFPTEQVASSSHVANQSTLPALRLNLTTIGRLAYTDVRAFAMLLAAVYPRVTLDVIASNWLLPVAGGPALSRGFLLPGIVRAIGKTPLVTWELIDVVQRAAADPAPPQIAASDDDDGDTDSDDDEDTLSSDDTVEDDDDELRRAIDFSLAEQNQSATPAAAAVTTQRGRTGDGDDDPSEITSRSSASVRKEQRRALREQRFEAAKAEHVKSCRFRVTHSEVEFIMTKLWPSACVTAQCFHALSNARVMAAGFVAYVTTITGVVRFIARRYRQFLLPRLETSEGWWTAVASGTGVGWFADRRLVKWIAPFSARLVALYRRFYARSTDKMLIDYCNDGWQGSCSRNNIHHLHAAAAGIIITATSSSPKVAASATLSSVKSLAAHVGAAFTGTRLVSGATVLLLVSLEHAISCAIHLSVQRRCHPNSYRSLPWREKIKNATATRLAFRVCPPHQPADAASRKQTCIGDNLGSCHAALVSGGRDLTAPAAVGCAAMDRTSPVPLPQLLYPPLPEHFLPVVIRCASTLTLRVGLSVVGCVLMPAVIQAVGTVYGTMLQIGVSAYAVSQAVNIVAITPFKLLTATRIPWIRTRISRLQSRLPWLRRNLSVSGASHVGRFVSLWLASGVLSMPLQVLVVQSAFGYVLFFHDVLSRLCRKLRVSPPAMPPCLDRCIADVWPGRLDVPTTSVQLSPWVPWSMIKETFAPTTATQSPSSRNSVTSLVRVGSSVFHRFAAVAQKFLQWTASPLPTATWLAAWADARANAPSTVGFWSGKLASIVINVRALFHGAGLSADAVVIDRQEVAAAFLIAQGVRLAVLAVVGAIVERDEYSRHFRLANRPIAAADDAEGEAQALKFHKLTDANAIMGLRAFQEILIGVGQTYVLLKSRSYWVMASWTVKATLLQYLCAHVLWQVRCWRRSAQINQQLLTGGSSENDAPNEGKKGMLYYS